MYYFVSKEVSGLGLRPTAEHLDRFGLVAGTSKVNTDVRPNHR